MSLADLNQSRGGTVELPDIEGRGQMPATLTAEEQHHLKQGIERLHERFRGQLNAPTVARFMIETVNEIGSQATTTKWVPLLAEKSATERLQTMLRPEGPVGLNPSVLFLCVHNAGRSQMAAGFMRHLSKGAVDVLSAGSEPAQSLNRVVVEAMAEKGIDIGEEIPRRWNDEIIGAAEVVVTMGCGDASPVFPGKRYVDWELDDPAGESIETVRIIRDEIERRVAALLEKITTPA